MNILLILTAYRWWIAAWIVSMAAIGIMEKKGRKKAPRRGNGMMRRTTKKAMYSIHKGA